MRRRRQQQYAFAMSDSAGRPTAEPTPLTWLHLSDIHFAQGEDEYDHHGQRRTFRALARDLKILKMQLGSPDVVFVTGDIAFSAGSRNNNEYIWAAEDLQTISDILQVPFSRFLMVPGNHDISRKAIRSVSRWIHAAVRQAPRELDAVLSDPAAMELLWEKFAAYQAFAGNFGAPEIDASKPFWETRLGPSVIAVGLNTALLCQDRKDSSRNLALGSMQLKALEEALDDNHLTFVLMHHPPNWLADGKLLLRVLAQRPHVLLTGHEHLRSAVVRSSDEGAWLHLAAGAVTAPKDEEPGAEDLPITPVNGYSWARLSSRGLEYYPRKWNDHLEEFVAADIPEHRRSVRENGAPFVNLKANELTRPMSSLLSCGVELQLFDEGFPSATQDLVVKTATEDALNEVICSALDAASREVLHYSVARSVGVGGGGGPPSQHTVRFTAALERLLGSGKYYRSIADFSEPRRRERLKALGRSPYFQARHCALPLANGLPSGILNFFVVDDRAVVIVVVGVDATQDTILRVASPRAARNFRAHFEQLWLACEPPRIDA